MPELPDVEVFRRRLDATSLGRAIERARVRDARILRGVTARVLAERLKGRRLQRSRRHGKHLFVEIGGDGWLALHFGMSGDLEPYGAGEPEPRYARVSLDFEDGGHLAYTSRRMLGHVGLADDADDFIRAERLGPDALDGSLTAAGFADAIGKGTRSIKAALMDQSAVAGIGNMFSDEILFQAGIHPAMPVAAFDRKRMEALFRHVREVLKTCIRHKAGTDGFMERLPGGYLLPHRAAGDACPRCGGEVESLKIAGRTAYFCPACQRL